MIKAPKLITREGHWTAASVAATIDAIDEVSCVPVTYNHHAGMFYMRAVSRNNRPNLSAYIDLILLMENVFIPTTAAIFCDEIESHSSRMHTSEFYWAMVFLKAKTVRIATMVPIAGVLPQVPVMPCWPVVAYTEEGRMYKVIDCIDAPFVAVPNIDMLPVIGRGASSLSMARRFYNWNRNVHISHKVFLYSQDLFVDPCPLLDIKTQSGKTLGDIRNDEYKFGDSDSFPLADPRPLVKESLQPFAGRRRGKKTGFPWPAGTSYLSALYGGRTSGWKVKVQYPNDPSNNVGALTLASVDWKS
ncbi:MAG TPA: hypothetical protein PLR82_08035 [Bacillota bacterium]|nr:hypothetical protein [Bacillota bacterium]HQD86822.1 hypothetical protein [Bacillota bacterium]